MSFFLMGLTALILIHSQLSLASEKSCNEIIGQANEISFTEDFWAYLKELIQNKQLSDDQKVQFYQSIISGKLTNPISHQMTAMGPIFKNSNDLIQYKKIEQFLRSGQHLNLKQLKNYLEQELDQSKLISIQKNVASLNSNSVLIRNEIIEAVKGNTLLYLRNDLFENLFLTLIKDNPQEIPQIAQKLFKSTLGFDKDYSFELLRKTNQLESNISLFNNDYSFLRGKFSYLEFENLNNPLEFTKTMIAANANDENLYIVLEKTLKILNEDQSEQITAYYKELLDSPIRTVKILAHYYYIKRSEVDGLDLAKQVFKENPSDNWFLINITSALSNYKSYDAVQFMNEILDDKNVGGDVRENLFKEFDGNSTPLHLKLINKAVNYREWGSHWEKRVIDTALKALQKCKGPKAFSHIKSLISRPLLFDSTVAAPLKFIFLLEDRPEKEVYNLALPYLTSNHKIIKLQAIQAISQLHYTDTRDAIFKFALESKSMEIENAVIYGMKNHDTEFLLPIIEYYKDKKEIPFRLFETLRGRTDEVSLDFVNRGLNNENPLAVEYALQNLESFDESIKMPILHDFISKTNYIQAKAKALKMLYGKSDQVTLSLMTEALKSKNFSLVMAALPGHIHALLINNTDTLKTNTSYKLILDSLALLNQK